MKKENINKPSWLNLINIDSVYKSDKQRQAFSLFSMIAFAIVVLTFLIISNYDVYSPILTVSLLVANMTIIGSTVYFIQSRELESVALTTMVIIFLMCVALTYTGGKENTALYWLMFYPVVTFATLGVKLGAWLSVFLIVCCLGLLYGPDLGQVQYGSVEKSRFIASFSLVFIFSFIGEFYRQKSHATIAKITLAQKKDAYTDQLTGAANRRFITSHFFNLVSEQPQNYLPFSILLIDLDYFKFINDNHGHDSGDIVLIEFTKLLESQFSSDSIKARYGGEEFVVILPKETVYTAEKIANNFRQSLANKTLLNVEKDNITLTCSIGVAQVNKLEEYGDALKQADQFLYTAKETGRNKVISDLT
ncbi:two-component system, cell cycle response regulator [Pseudoalteromonas sp. BSi20652]|uniref:GGDEF domain-containing protein n=1 Tax=Pseudoalteromonas sp. BSi20652 TaxID=388384 RepID=UPI0002319699|nr:GGDEF domain-containing protein [Pseudoalteromonas sp. BSi20652]GAA60656.1 two-component system, cell cycle response regulator [Pseudoalteromonas sp. BSi20652]